MKGFYVMKIAALSSNMNFIGKNSAVGFTCTMRLFRNVWNLAVI
jgi:hypothetical protein